MKKLYFLLIISILFLTPKAFALEYNMNSKTSATLNGTKNRYLGTEIYNTGTSNTYTFGTRYNGRLSAIDTYFDYPFEANTTYTLTYNMNTEDFRNNFGGKYWWDCSDTMNATNQHTGSFTYVSYKKVKFSFTPSENTTCIRVLLGSTNLSSTAITGVSNWRLDSITLYDPDYQSGSGGGQGSTSTPTPTPNNNQDIINNQNNNTQDIINNNNQNTSDIIENNNENTESIINNQNELLGDCITNLWNGEYVNAYLSQQSGNVYFYSSSSGTRTIVVPVSPNKTYTIEKFANTGTGSRFVIGGSDTALNFGDMVPYIYYDNSSSLKTTITTNSNTNYLYIYITNNTSNIPFINVLEGSSYYSSYLIDKVCQSKLDSTNNAINNVNDSINNDNIDSGVGSDFFDDFSDEDFGLSSIITIPLNTIQSLTSKTCLALNVPIPFTNSTVSLPCMTEVYEQNIPTIYNLWKIVSFGIIAYFIAIDIFHMVKGFKDPESDKVEVLDL